MARLVISAVGYRAALENDGTDLVGLVAGVALSMLDVIAGRPQTPADMVNDICRDLDELGWRLTTGPKPEDETLHIHAEWIWSAKDVSLYVGRGGGGDYTYWQGMLRQTGKDRDEIKRWMDRNGKRVTGVVDITDEMIALLDHNDHERY